MSVADRRWLIAGALFFIIVKLAFVITPVFVMGMPRIGDDSFVYLWLGESTVLAPHDDTPGVNSIRALYDRDDAPGEDVAYHRARASVHVTSVNASPYSLVTLALLRTGLEHAVQWAILESLVALALCYGISRFLFALFGPRVAALGLVFLAFLILPEQGIHFLVPGVLALALALVAWARAIEGRADWRQALLCFVLCLVHPISYAYTAMAAALAFAVPTAREHRIILPWRAPLWSLAGGATAVIVATLLGARQAQSTVAASLDLANIVENALAVINFFVDAIEDAPFLTLAAIAGTVVGVRTGALNWVTALVAAALLCAVCLTPFVDIPGYPGAVGARVQVAFAIYVAGVAALAALGLISTGARTRVAAGWALVALVTVSLMPATRKAMLANLNNRYDITNRHDIRQTLSELPAGEPVIWLEPDTIMIAAFVEGAWSRPAYPYQALGSAVTDVLSDQPSILLGTRIPLPLNSRAAMWDHSLRKRFNGYSFYDVSEVRVTMRGAALAETYVRIEGAEGEVEVSLLRGRIACGVGQLDPAKEDGWRRIDTSACPGADSVVLSTLASDIRVTGLASGRLREGVSWPWDVEGLAIQAAPRREARIPLHVAFGLTALLEEAGAAALGARLHSARLISDRGGMVLLRANVR